MLFPPQDQTIDKGHGRLELRTIWTSTDLNDYVRFPHCRQVVCIQRLREHIKTGKIQTETVYGITSLAKNKANPSQLLTIARGHWSIENKNHYVRDFTFDEDRSQVRTGAGPRIMASLRHFAISILRLQGHTNIAKAIRTMAAKPHLAMKMVTT